MSNLICRTRARRLAVIVCLAALLFGWMPASAAVVSYRAVAQSVVVRGGLVSATVVVTADVAVTADTFGICVRDSFGVDHAPAPRREVLISTPGARFTASMTLGAGTYRYWACGRVARQPRVLSPSKTFLVDGPRGIAGAWRMTFHDEFGGRALNTAKWSTGWFGSGVTGPVDRTEDACYDPAQVQFRGDGALSIVLAVHSATCSGRTRTNTTGLVTTNGSYSFAYGVSEARIYLPYDAAGRPVNWPAFWTDGQHWPVDGENDVMEAMDGSVGPHFHSPSGGPGYAVPGSWGGWHTFGSRWEPGRVTYYYDGVDVGSITEGITSAPMYLILGFGPSATETTVPARMRVDYVRVWQH